MSAEDEYKKKKTALISDEESDDETGQSGETGTDTGTGGQTGQIEFRDFIGTGDHLREDLLPDEIKRLLSVHNDINQANVKKQKEKRDHYKALKEGKVTLAQHRQGYGNSANSQYQRHPVLADKAQFSGVDRQVNAVPTENIADTNEANRNELENQYRLRHAPTNAPRFNPKPQFRQ